MIAPRLDEEAVFHIARKIPLAVREEYLLQACGDDSALRDRVQALLRVHDQEQSFLHSPAQAPDATGDLLPVTERPGTTIGPYKLLQQIGEGGMGVVFMAEQTAPIRRMVALKVVKAGLDSAQAVARFETERQALALMDHPNIARVLDAGATAAGQPYFVMELVKGVPITKYCDDRRLTTLERLALFVPVCQAVQHAHTKGVIHRDLKPSNVLIALYDGKPAPKVIDFGIAKATGQKLTERTLFTGFGVVVGTPEYMSPEQAELNQLDVDTRSDVYSLGALLYELLTGEPPLDRKKLGEGAVLEVLRHIREVEPPKPSTRLSTSEALPSVAASRSTEPARLTRLLRGELDWVVMKALEKDRNLRYETASALALDLQRYLNDEPVLAGRRGVGYRLRRSLKIVLPVLLFGFVWLLGIGMLQWWMRFDIRRTTQKHQIENRAMMIDYETRRVARQFFEEKVLGAARPRDKGGPGNDVTLRQALAAADRQIDPTYASRPLHEASVRDEVGRIYLLLGEPALAARQYQRSLELRRQHRYTDDPAFAPAQDEDLRRGLEQSSDTALRGTLEQLARALAEQERWAEAEPLRREALASREKTQPDDWQTFEARSLLGAALLGQKRYAEAEPLLLSGYKGMKALHTNLDDAGRRKMVEAGERIVALYLAWGKPDTATEWRSEVKAPANP